MLHLPHGAADVQLHLTADSMAVAGAGVNVNLILWDELDSKDNILVVRPCSGCLGLLLPFAYCW